MRVSSESYEKHLGKQPTHEAAHSDLIYSCGSMEILALCLISSPPGDQCWESLTSHLPFQIKPGVIVALAMQCLSHLMK